MFEIFRGTKKANTLGIQETVALLGKNIILEWFNPALNINRANSPHVE
jgi:hypothetical protein